MSASLSRSEGGVSGIGDCSYDYASQRRDEVSTASFMSDEICEISRILSENKRKMEVLLQINACIAEALSADNEAVVK